MSHSLLLNIAGIIRKAVYLCAVVLATMGSEELTEAEAKVYDRQLRVWGVEFQRRWEQTSSTCLDCFDVALIKDPKSSLSNIYTRRLNAAKILIAGITSGIAAEVCRCFKTQNCTDLLCT